jgi:DNA/RNA-binding domain of Phe-tRNA-synthetase-like protein
VARTPQRGWVDPDLAAELPGLELLVLRVSGSGGRSPAPVRDRLRELAGRITGAHVVHLRQDDVPWAYRVLWRHLGLDPDSDRTPIERLMVDRLVRGGLPSRGLPDDALALATLETGVPVLAFDAARVGASLGLRSARAGETLDDGPAGRLTRGELIYADERPLARLDGEVAERCAVSAATRAVALCALCAPNVARVAADEALWTAAEVLGGAGTLDEVGPPGRKR